MRGMAKYKDYVEKINSVSASHRNAWEDLYSDFVYLHVADYSAYRNDGQLVLQEIFSQINSGKSSDKEVPSYLQGLVDDFFNTFAPDKVIDKEDDKEKVSFKDLSKSSVARVNVAADKGIIKAENLKSWIKVAEKEYTPADKTFTEDAVSRDVDELSDIVNALKEAKKPAFSNSKEYKNIEKQAKELRDLAEKMKGGNASLEDRANYNKAMTDFGKAAQAYLDHKAKDGIKTKDAYKVAAVEKIKSFVSAKKQEIEKTVIDEYKSNKNPNPCDDNSKHLQDALCQLYPSKKETIIDAFTNIQALRDAYSIGEDKSYSDKLRR